MSFQFKLIYDNPQNFVFSDTIIEVILKAQLKAIVAGAEAYMYAKLDDNNDLVVRDSSGNSRDGALQGGYDATNKVSGKINNGIQGISSTAGIINFGNSDFNFTKNDAFSLECWIKFTSTTAQALISKQDDLTPFRGYVLNAVGIFRWVIRDELGNVLSVETANSYNDDIFHHLVVTYDGSNTIDGLKIYVDNIEDRVVFTNTPLVGDCTNTKNFQISGKDGNNSCILSSTIIDEVLVYARALTPAEIAFRWNLGAGTQEIPGASTSFSTANPKIRSNEDILATQINSVVGTVTEPGSDSIELIALVDGQAKYWNGSAWVDSTGEYPQSNDIATFSANVSTLLSSQSSFNVDVVLHSDTGTTTPDITDLTIDFDRQSVSPVNIFTSSMYIDVFETDSDIDTRSAKVYLITEQVLYKDTITLYSEETTAQADSQGRITFTLAETVNMQKLPDGNEQYYVCELGNKTYKFNVPETSTANILENLI